MNFAKILALIFVLSAPFSVAATTLYTMNTGLTVDSSGIANSAGLQYQNGGLAGAGVISFGYFSGLSDAQITSASDVSTLTGAYQMWNATTTVFASPGPAQSRGVFSSVAVARDIVADGFSGNFMYLFVGNASTYALSTEFLVLKSTFTFNIAETGPTTFTKTITTSNTSILVGGADPDVRTTLLDGTATPGWRTATLIPEPSSALLAAIGALGLLGRRRN